MPNGFTKTPKAEPATIADGEAVTITLFYEYTPVIVGERAPEVQITSSPEFAITVAPAVVALAPAANGSVSVGVTIRRGTDAPTFCTLVFNALDDERQKAVTVTP